MCIDVTFQSHLKHQVRKADIISSEHLNYKHHSKYGLMWPSRPWPLQELSVILSLILCKQQGICDGPPLHFISGGAKAQRIGRCLRDPRTSGRDKCEVRSLLLKYSLKRGLPTSLLDFFGSGWLYYRVTGLRNTRKKIHRIFMLRRFRGDLPAQWIWNFYTMSYRIKHTVHCVELYILYTCIYLCTHVYTCICVYMSLRVTKVYKTGYAYHMRYSLRLPI
jgi:hypothetical protein